jgi:hypothetical protein
MPITRPGSGQNVRYPSLHCTRTDLCTVSVSKAVNAEGSTTQHSKHFWLFVTLPGMEYVICFHDSLFNVGQPESGPGDKELAE